MRGFVTTCLRARRGPRRPPRRPRAGSPPLRPMYIRRGGSSVSGQSTAVIASTQTHSKTRMPCGTSRPPPISARLPPTKRMLKRLLPSRLPSEMSEWPRAAPTTQVTSSGRLVPKATTVAPSTRSLMPRSLPSAWAPLVKRVRAGGERAEADQQEDDLARNRVRVLRVEPESSTSAFAKELRNIRK